MRKLKLDLDALEVESFLVTPAAADDGTVQGRLYDNSPPTALSCIDCATAGTCVGPTYCCPATWKPSCAATCYYTECGNSCFTWWCNSCAMASCHATCDAAVNTCGDVDTCTSI